MEFRHESAEVREAANICVQALVDSYLNEKPDEATLARVRREMFEIKPIPTNKVAQKPGSHGALWSACAQARQGRGQADFQGWFKAPPVRVVTTKQAPPEVKKPPPPPPPREDRQPIPVRSRTPVRPEARG